MAEVSALCFSRRLSSGLSPLLGTMVMDNWFGLRGVLEVDGPAWEQEPKDCDCTRLLGLGVVRDCLTLGLDSGDGFGFGRLAWAGGR
jgi:hypothetical protein